MRSKHLFTLFILFAGLMLVLSGWSPFAKKIDFSTQVKPILNKHCIACHGGVKKQAGFSVLFEEEAFAPTKSGKIAIIRGDAANSEFIKRLSHTDPQERMPLDAPPLSKEEISTLTQWIEEGATWGEHWAYQPIEEPSVPWVGTFWGHLGLVNDEENDWTKNEIDHFVLDKLKTEGLTPSKKADKGTLLRRVYLDLIGIPPSELELQAFLNDKSEDAYEKVVDNLLKSPQFGEKWASFWLDLARYADTKGYERDAGRNIWRYRDYVIRAFNDDKPFDQFTVEQLAGDLLPKPTDEQLIATAFHRNTMNNDEGGTVDEEFRVAALLDRVSTTWDVWQGSTFSCVQCHSHPYDPIRHEEYYKFMAFFNQARDEDVYTETPTLRFYPKTDSLKVSQLNAWIKQKLPQQANNYQHFLRVLEPKINSHDIAQIGNASLVDEKNFGFQHGGAGLLKNVTLTNKNTLLMAIGADAGADSLSIIEVRLNHARGKLLTRFKPPKTGGGWSHRVIAQKIPSIQGKHHLYFSLHNPAEPKKWIQIGWLALQEALPDTAKQNQYLALLNTKVESNPIMQDGQGDLARKTHIFERGNWLVKGKEVAADIPTVFGKMDSNYPKNRLGMAKWLVSEENPLTARVAVNRFWEQIFGTGIIETVEDFGTQGFAASHPELLDFLAVQFRDEFAWSVKKLLKYIVLSATYQQSSEVSPVLLSQDPYNRLLARGARVRLSAEQVRDQALAVSGLLSKKMYGASIMPPQPEGVWSSPWNDSKWETSEGENKYRRGLYIYWKRTSPYPSMMTFDSPSREFCQQRRIRTNTPLQALVTLNDPVYVEAAQKLAEKILLKKGNITQQIVAGYGLVMHKPIESKRLKILEKLYHQAFNHYKKHPKESTALVASPNASLAAMTITANTILNLDEVVTKE